MSWDPAQYLAFADQRLRPAVDLLHRVPLASPATVVDLGCGAGNVTKLLRERWPSARIIGVDGSAAMLERARASDPSIDWLRADLAEWRPDGPVDLLFSNAALHWLDHHATLFPALVACLAPGGVLAAQMPRNFTEASHTALYATVRAGPWRERLEPLIRPAPTHAPEYYADALAPHVAALDVWETTYLQVLTGENPVAEFVKGSALGPFLAALAGPERAELEAAYRARIRAAYPERSDGTTLFPFRRVFVVATRGPVAEPPRSA
jgi:trans-aconitate 2-methyltransferase